MKIDTFIEFFKLLFDEKRNPKGMGNAAFVFVRGGCFQFAELLKRYYPEATLMINPKQISGEEKIDHCMVSYENDLFDIEGRASINSRKHDVFVEALSEDIDDMRQNFGYNCLLPKYLGLLKQNYLDPFYILASILPNIEEMNENGYMDWVYLYEIILEKTFGYKIRNRCIAGTPQIACAVYQMISMCKTEVSKEEAFRGAALSCISGILSKKIESMQDIFDAYSYFEPVLKFHKKHFLSGECDIMNEIFLMYETLWNYKDQFIVNDNYKVKGYNR